MKEIEIIHKNIKKIKLLLELYNEILKKEIPNKEQLEINKLKAQVAKKEILNLIFENHKVLIRAQSNFLNQSKTFNDIFCISEGTSGILRIMDIYHLFFKHFKTAGKIFPVIIVVDNDQGSKGIRKKSILKKS